MTNELNTEELGNMANELEKSIQKAIEDSGYSSYQLDSLKLKPKEDKNLRGLGLGCSLQCSANGFPPSISCSVVCG